MTVKLTRGTGPRQWESYRSSDTSPVLVFFRCAFCGLIATLQGGNITADGLVPQAVTCPTPTCRVTYRLYLEGWQHNAVEHPAAFASYPSCAAFGSSN